MKSIAPLAALLLGAIAPAAAADAPAHPTLAIGASAPDFDLPGTDGKRYSLASFADAKLVVLVFTANHCPTAQAYEERLERLAAEYAPRGVTVVMVSPNDPLAVRLDEQGYSDMGDSLADMAQRARDRGWTWPYLYDGETQAMARAYGPVATPHVFVLDAERKLRFAGRVDDNENPAKTKTRDTRDAIEALLAGKPVAAPTTRVFGCSIKWADKRSWVDKGREEWAREPVSLEPVDTAAIQALGRNEDGKKLRLINVWATWCGPCVIEFPDLVDLNRIYRGRDFEVVTLNADEAGNRRKALEFLKQRQASTRNYAFDGENMYALVEALDAKWPGALPHTILVAPGGAVVYRSQGAFETLALRKAIVGWLGRYYHSAPGGK
jgi:thiol-disulfide isomerase/thioredoxin